MSRHHRNLLRSVFHDPPSGNIHWRDIESLLKHVGATLEPLSGARIRARLNRMEGILHRPHHSNTLDTSSLLHLREFLARAGVTPSQYEAKEAQRDSGETAGRPPEG
jgi:hypothetical protein